MRLEEKLVSLRKKSGLTQAELAEKMMVSRQAISRWEVGAAVPTTENLTYLSQLYGVSVDDLLHDDKDMAERDPEPVIEFKACQTEKTAPRFQAWMGWAAAGLAILLLVLFVWFHREGEAEVLMQEIQGEVVELRPENGFDLEW